METVPYYHHAAPEIEMGTTDKTDVMSPQQISFDVTGDCVLVKKEPYAGFYAVVLAPSYGEELEIEYFEKKEGLPWGLKENDYDSNQKLTIETYLS